MSNSFDSSFGAAHAPNYQVGFGRGATFTSSWLRRQATLQMEKKKSVERWWWQRPTMTRGKNLHVHGCSHAREFIRVSACA
jgi:hypothetical protein